MSNVASSFQNQKITIVRTAETNSYGDAESTGDPIEISCEIGQTDKAMMDNQGVQFVPDYVIYTSTDVSEYPDGMTYLYIGAIADIGESNEPYTIRSVKEVPSLPGMGGSDWVIYV